MSFNSLAFILFAIVFFAAWPIFRTRRRTRWLYLTIASFVFYSWSTWYFLPLLVATGLIDFFAALAVVRYPRGRRAWLALSIAANLASLAIFKYSAFACSAIDQVIAAWGCAFRTSDHLPPAATMLPIGISFYTFQSMSYTIDVYRRRLEPTRDILHFFAFLTLFPQLIAGPIVRAASLLPQLEESRPASEARRWHGLRLIVTGFFKKLVIADNLAPAVNEAFGRPVNAVSGASWWVTMAMFTLQIYSDFSGYSDIARGLANWMGYSLTRNFRRPYRSQSMREFWTRWHVSLSSWFRDYVYVPLGGSRGGAWRSHRNLWATMLLSGLWHGAAWHFIAWGALHASAVSVERITSWPQRLSAIRGGRSLSWVITSLTVLLGWVFFRSPSIEQAGRIIASMFTIDLGAVSTERIAFVVLVATVVAAAIRRFAPVRPLSRQRRLAVEMGLVTATATMCVYLRGRGSAFIYFQF